MFTKLFGKKPSSSDEFPATVQAPEDRVFDPMGTQRLQATAGSASAELAAQLLTAPTALMQLSLDEAKVVVSYMDPKKIPEGTLFIKEGDRKDTGYMLLVLEGEVTVESIVVSRVSPVTVTVLGPGSLIGEMGLVDGEPRSASCTATSDLRCAILTRKSLGQLMNDEPAVGGKLMMAVALRIAERMRDTADKLKLYSQLTQAMQQEIDKLMPT